MISANKRLLIFQNAVVGRAICRSSLTRRHHTSRSSASTSKPSTEKAKTPETSPDSILVNAPRVRGRDDDALSRFPSLKSPGGILRGVDYAGTITFAITGSVTAAQSGLDVFGCSMVGMVTAVGGGTIRDAVFLCKRPFWTSETEYVWMPVIAGLLTFCAWPYVLDWQLGRQQHKQNQQIRRRWTPSGRETTSDNPTDSTSTEVTDVIGEPYYDELDATLDTFDAIGLAAFAIVGAQNGVRAGMPIVVSSICGMATSTFGGILRDVLCGRPVRIVHSNAEAYAPLALAGAITYLFARRLNASPGARIGSALFVCMGSRFFAIKHDVKLHTWDTSGDGLGVAIRK